MSEIFHNTAVEIENKVYGASPGQSGPIGGGDGYRNIVASGDYTVKDLDALLEALSKAKAGQVVFIPGEIEIDLHMMVFDGGLSEIPAVGGHVSCDMPAPAHGTLEGAIEEVKGVKLVRKVDKDTGVIVTFPVKE